MEDFNPKQKSQGLGDTIAKFTHFFGIDKLADWVAKMFGKKDCGCNRRRKQLNKIVSYKDDNNRPK
jgi:hypothetical protein